MTEDEKYEIEILAKDMDRKRAIFEAHQIMNRPTNPIERQTAAAAYYIAETEYIEAHATLCRAQKRITNKEEIPNA